MIAKIAKPNLIGIGPGRSGTTYLHEFLLTHKDVYIAPQKETNFFCSNADIDDDDFEKYLTEHFSGATTEQYRAEISPSYITPWAQVEHATSGRTAAAMKSRLDAETKLILTLRSPVSRLFSQFKFDLRYYSLTGERLGRIAQLSEKHTFLCFEEMTGLAYIADDVQNFIDQFGRENILVLVYETDFVGDSTEALNKTTDFLGIDRFAVSKQAAQIQINSTQELEILFGSEHQHVTPSMDGRDADSASSIALAPNQMYLRSGWYPLDAVVDMDPDEEPHWRLCAAQIKDKLSRAKEKQLNEELYRDEIHKLEDTVQMELAKHWLP